MILVQREDTLPVAVQQVKREVLLCLQAVHMLHTYDTATDLADFLDTNMKDAGITGLTRVTLFYRDLAIYSVVSTRMAAKGVMTSYPQPSCWMRLGLQLPDLRKQAERYEPGFVARELAKDQ